MIRLKTWGLVVLALLTTPAVEAQEAQGSQRVAPISESDRALLPKGEDQFRWTVEQKTVAHRNFNLLFPSETIRAGARVSALPAGEPIVPSYEFDGAARSIDDYFARTNAAGLLVLKDGRIVFERYAMGNGPETNWTSRSMAKSFTSTLVGAAVHDGKIASLDDPVSKYVPELKDTRYGKVSIRHALQMTSGMPDREFPSVLPLQACTVKRERGCFLKGLVAIADPTRPGYAEPGTRFSYLSADVIVSGLVVQRATGMTPSAYLSSKIWKPFGMERDAYWNLEAEGGDTFANSGIGATLRDYGRFGLFMMDGGRLPDGTRILPENWMAEALAPTIASEIASSPYGFYWWRNHSANGTPGEQGVFYARGSAGQTLVVNPEERLVIVKWSVWPDRGERVSSRSLQAEDDALFDSMTKALHR
jgi:CubicO group peptidase (beta-lactamase class C family)